MRCVAIIPARSGSKRIPKKNIKAFLGKPILSYPIEAAKKTGLFSRIIVSTDDSEIAQLARSYGADVPFFRSKKNSDDFASTVDVLLEVIIKLSELGEAYDLVCCLYPTAVFAKPKLINVAYESICQNNFDSIFTATRYDHPVQRALSFNDDGFILMRYPENEKLRTQDLKTYYHDAGQIYFTKISNLLNEKSLLTSRSSAIILPKLNVHDIDFPEDWEIAQIKYNLLHAQP